MFIIIRGRQIGVLVLPGTFTLALSRNSSRKPSAASRFHAGRTEIRYKFFLGFVSAFLRGIVLFQIFSSRVTKTAALRLVAENAEECFNY